MVFNHSPSLTELTQVLLDDILDKHGKVAHPSFVVRSDAELVI